MKIGKSFSFVILLVVALSSVGFTTLSWYCPMETKTEKMICGSCAEQTQQAPDCTDDACCKQYGELMKIQPDLSAAVKVQPNMDSPQSEGLVQLPEEFTPQSKAGNYHRVFQRALPDRVAYEHVVLRI